ncbi:hypothetical protein H2198_000419 [Neophaeococcomyces mojaviensis]|uniref:Uncharacterized protein n=1 Tax=Neophaeococcomyces mojaviensis TaxID=3383035 RepID=A0ACC3AK73_9EURO|nr:hypothetical protein H2198_000419 [Knufia sp. JES_112]
MSEDAMVSFAVKKYDAQGFCKQDDMPMQLRMFGEVLDGMTVARRSRTTMLEMKVEMDLTL